jgi:hypothetical protein
MDTARLRTVQGEEARRRAERDADAARYLIRRGHVDLLPILGLGDSPIEEVDGACVRCGGPLCTGQRKYCTSRCKNAVQQRAWRDRRRAVT